MKTSTTSHNIGIRVLAIVFWIAIWQIVSMRLGQEILLASPVSVMQSLGRLLVTGEFWSSVGFSFGRIVTGFLLALVLGTACAVLSCAFAPVRILLGPLVTVVKSTPVASFIILCLIWIPSRNLSVFISFLMVFPVVYRNLQEGILQTDKGLLEMAKVYKLSFIKQVQYIYVSSVLPFFLSACSLGLGLCWKAGVAAEVIGVPSGSIGEKLYHAKIYLNTPDLLAWTVVIIAISFIFERCFLGLVKMLVQRAERA